MGKAVGKAVPMERANTELIESVEGDPSRPVFVDPSGVRRRRLRWMTYVLGVLLVLTLALAWWSQLGGTSSPPAGRTCASAGTTAGCGR